VRVTHRFHPWFGRELEFCKRRKNYGADLVCVYDPTGRLVSLPVSWTDLAAPDPFVEVAAGRAAFRTQDLLALAEVLDRLASPAPDDDPSVTRITP
jgi:hypothetical protein